MVKRVLIAGLLAAGAMSFGQVACWALPEVGGVVGLASETGAGWLAVRVPMPEGQALAGVSWFNNDDQAMFPQVLVATGYPDGPGDLVGAEVVAETVGGGASAWSSLSFDVPVASSLEALYVVFAFPEGHAYTEPGSGGGSALGYLAAEGGSRGWLSGDGSSWIGLDPAHAFAVLPEFVPFAPGMVVKSMGGSGGYALQPDPVAEPYLTAGPNPFNPLISLRFGLVTAGRTTVDVFDIRGRRVVRLLDEALAAGHHQVDWQGRDGAGRGVASGVYFVKMAGPDGGLTRRVLLVR
jgi:hypothetical protein